MRYLTPIFLLALVYLAITGNLEILNIIAGVIVAALVVLLTKPQLGPRRWRRFPKSAWAFIRYVLVLVYDLLVSGIQVARIVLNPSLPIKPGTIAIDSECKSEVSKTLSAHAITLTPGELVIEMGEDGVMYTHCLDASKSDEVIEKAQSMREELLVDLFE